MAGLSGFALTSLLVWAGVTDGLDRAARDLFRPGDVWGPEQVRFGPLIDGLAPPRMFALLAVTTLAAVVVRRSARPALLAVALVVPTLAVTGVVKFLVSRPDPHAVMSATGGSYPSGHMVALIASVGGCLLVWEVHGRWYLWLPVPALAVGMALALLFGATHWLTDIIGGTFLALGMLGVTALVERALPPRRDRVGRQTTSTGV